MDYQDIILEGYFDDRGTLDDFFLEKAEEAESNSKSSRRLFQMFLKVIDVWEESLNKKVEARKDKLYIWKNQLSNGTAIIPGVEGKDFEDARNVTLRIWDRELQTISEENYSVDIHFCGKDYGMSYQEVLYIKNSILKASQIIEEKKAGSVPSTNESLLKSTEINQPVLPNISFDSPETKDKLFLALKGFFPGQEGQLKDVLDGHRIEEKLFFPSLHSSFSEVFCRLKYNNKILDDLTVIRDWICANFQFRYRKGIVDRIQDFNEDSVYGVLTRKAEPVKKNRILQDLEWLPFIHKNFMKN